MGENRAHDFSYPAIKVTDGILKIDFDRIVEFPCIAGIVIEGRTDAGQPFVRKINCGGPAYKDYEADDKQPQDQSDRRSMPVEEFYLDFARANFGNERIGRILAAVDGRVMPEPVNWIGGPGGIAVNTQPWEQVKTRYAFVDELADARADVRGAGNLERFDYWLNTYRYMASVAELGCLRGELDAKAAAIKAAPEAVMQRTLADEALPIRVRMARLWERMMAYQLSAVDTPGEMGTVANIEQHSRGTLKFLNAQDELLTQALGSALPQETEVSKAYTGAARIIVPTVRTQVNRGESLSPRVILLDEALPKSVTLHCRPLGKGDFSKRILRNIGRATYEAGLPPAEGSFEYYITAETSDGRTLTWPATAPKIAQTVVVWDTPGAQ